MLSEEIIFLPVTRRVDPQHTHKKLGPPRSTNPSNTQWEILHKAAMENSGNMVSLTPKSCTNWVLRNSPQIDVPGDKGLLVINIIKCVRKMVFLYLRFQY
jgi:hypothetical protein